MSQQACEPARDKRYKVGFSSNVQRLEITRGDDRVERSQELLVMRFGPVISTHPFGASRVTLSVNAGAIKLTTMSGAITTNRRRLVAG